MAKHYNTQNDSASLPVLGDSHHAFAFPFVLIFLPLRLSCKESSTSNQASLNSLYDPFGSPCRGQKPQKEGCKPPSGAQNRYALRLADHQRSSPWLCGMGPLCYNLL